MPIGIIPNGIISNGIISITLDKGLVPLVYLFIFLRIYEVAFRKGLLLIEEVSLRAIDIDAF